MKIQRYQPVLREAESCQEMYVGMWPNGKGSYVLYEDYAKLESEVVVLTVECGRLRAIAARLLEIEQQLWQRTKEKR